MRQIRVKVIKKKVEVKIKILVCNFIVWMFCVHIESRSPKRYQGLSTPTIYAYFTDETQKYALRHTYISEGPYRYLFDRTYFFQRLLPASCLEYRNKKGSISGKALSKIVHAFLEEVLAGKENYTHMTVLKKKDYDARHKAGLIIARFKNYPFVIKLFVENPASFTQPFTKGFEPWCFFMLGGGANRHLTGFTRIKNREHVLKKLSSNNFYKDIVDIPRKWYWLPDNPKWMVIQGTNIGPENTFSVEIPSVYGIICDYIDIERTFKLSRQADRRIALYLSNFLQQAIDPHINNFAIEKDTKKIVLLDTEHFPTMVGYQNTPLCKSYIQWYTHLSSNALRKVYGQSKSELQSCQHKRYCKPIALQ